MSVMFGYLYSIGTALTYSEAGHPVRVWRCDWRVTGIRGKAHTFAIEPPSTNGCSLSDTQKVASESGYVQSGYLERSYL